MKKRSKIILSLLLLVCLSSSVLVQANAGWSWNAMKGPGGTSGEWVNSVVDKTLTTSTGDANGSEIRTYFENYKTLPSGFKSSSERLIKIKAFEDDPTGDDHFKTYTADFNGRTINKFIKIEKHITGSVEGNRYIELYLSQNLYPVKGDAVTAYTTLYSFYFATDS